MRRPGRDGFTLVELLVVMSVMSILAAIILPATLRARGLARNVQCVANLGQMAKAVEVYLDDHETWYPSASVLPSAEPEPGLPRICDVLEPKGPSGMFECPDDRPRDPEYTFGTYFVGEGSSYEWATLFNGRRQGAGITLGRRGFSIEGKNIPLFSDYEPFHKRGNLMGLNAVFTDSHVESF